MNAFIVFNFVQFRCFKSGLSDQSLTHSCLNPLDPDQMQQNFALKTGISRKHDDNSKLPDTPSSANRLVQRVVVEESTQHKLVKQSVQKGYI